MTFRTLFSNLLQIVRVYNFTSSRDTCRLKLAGSVVLEGFEVGGIGWSGTYFGGLHLFLLLSIFLACNLSNETEAQGLQTSPYSAPSMLRGLSSGGLDLAPSNPLGLPGSSAPGAGGSGSLYLSEGMLRGILPLIPNLQFGYLYDFGNNRVSSGRFTADYLLPFSLSRDSMIFGEAHTEFQDFWKTQQLQ